MNAGGKAANENAIVYTALWTTEEKPPTPFTCDGCGELVGEVFRADFTLPWFCGICFKKGNRSLDETPPAPESSSDPSTGNRPRRRKPRVQPE